MIAEARPRQRFVVLGAGGLGCPVLLGLLAAGARHVMIVDRDRVDTSNLQRQVLYDVGDVGAVKARAAAQQLRRRAPDLAVDARVLELDAGALDALLDEVAGDAIVLECSDSPALKFMVNDGCLARGIPAVIAGAIGWRGQVIAIARGAGACYRCLFEEPPPPELSPVCATAGVIGGAVGLFGHLMAVHAWRLGAGDRQGVGALLAVDLLGFEIHTLRPRPRPGCPACAGRGISAPSPELRRCASGAAARVLGGAST